MHKSGRKTIQYETKSHKINSEKPKIALRESNITDDSKSYLKSKNSGRMKYDGCDEIARN